jgi:CBS-domain-containing membrane protein
VTKLFSLIPSESRFESLRWLAASLSTAIAVVVMQVTQTTHPPAGATALLPAVDDAVWDLSWYFLAVVLLSSTMIFAVALVVNNVQRRYPVYWYEPAKPAALKPPQLVAEQPIKVSGSSDLQVRSGWLWSLRHILIWACRLRPLK